MNQACPRQNMPSGTLQKWASAADGTLSSRINGTSELQTLATSGHGTASQLSRPQPQVARRQPLRFRLRQQQVSGVGMTREKRNGASFKSYPLYLNMGLNFCILEICIFTIERCIVPPMAWNDTAPWAWKWNHMSTALLALELCIWVGSEREGGYFV